MIFLKNTLVEEVCSNTYGVHWGRIIGPNNKRPLGWYSNTDRPYTIASFTSTN